MTETAGESSADHERGQTSVSMQELFRRVALAVLLLPMLIVFLAGLPAILLYYYFVYVPRRQKVVKGLGAEEAPWSLRRSLPKWPWSVRGREICRELPLDDFERCEAGDTPMPRFEQKRLENYSCTYCVVANVCHVTSEQEIVAAVCWASRTGNRVRAMGSLFSWPEMVADGRESVVLSLQEYNRFLSCTPLTEADGQGTAALAEVEAGMKIWQLNAELDKLGYTMPTLGNVTGSQWAASSPPGHMVSGCSETRCTFGTISSLVERVRLVTADGSVEVIEVAAGGDRGRAVGVSVGMLGVLSTVTLRVERKHDLEFHIDTCDFEDGLRRFPELLDQNEAVSLVYWPTLDRWRIEVATRPSPKAEGSRKCHPMPQHSRLKIFFSSAFNVLLSYYYWVPGLLRLAHKFASTDGHSEFSYRGPSYSVVALNVELDIEHHEVEFAFDLAQFADVMRAYRDAMLGLPTNVYAFCMIDVRATGGDEAWLSPAFGRKTVWLDVVMPMRIKKHFKKLCAAVVPVAESFGGRPHWGKINPSSAEYTRACFPKFAEFATLKREMDPNRVFGCTWLDNFFDCASGLRLEATEELFVSV
eukprot:CAMPEP_0117458530 /NCGR_PEP_ID=MMETSP0784-20121206/981_1 /TAXON_ID=39447 /ORGANISM="" /LENGTH=586 /DNA_ID=CAMNT_0005252057 /DNA_START=35 /DNA_END=1796 /DNA_ORIENTATION=-